MIFNQFLFETNINGTEYVFDSNTSDIFTGVDIKI